MHEYICRAKRKENGQWIRGYYCRHEKRQPNPMEYSLKEDNIQHLILYDGFAGWNMSMRLMCAEIILETLGSYSGVNVPKNNQKIFEGDICSFYIFDYNGGDKEYQGVVVRSGSRYMLWHSKDSEYFGSDGGFDLDWVVAQDDEFEVIGNITDNPEWKGV